MNSLAWPITTRMRPTCAWRARARTQGGPWREGARACGAFAKTSLLFLVLTQLLCALFLRSALIPIGPRRNPSLHPAGPRCPRARRRDVGWHGAATAANREPLRHTEEVDPHLWDDAQLWGAVG